MTETITTLIHQYGYLALFGFLFLQEVGAPNPIPNELVLIISGYLIYSGLLSFWGVLSVIILSDVLAAMTLYTAFYFFGAWFIRSKPKWIPISTKSIIKLNQKIKDQGISVVFFGRLTPFIRGYVAVVSGLTQINAKRYMLIVMATTILWGVFYISIGYILSHYWKIIEPQFSKTPYLLGAILIIVLSVWVIKKIKINLFLKS